MPELSGAASLNRLLIVTTVVLASAGIGYVGSRIWPLPPSHGPAAHSVTAGDTAPAPTPQVSGWVGAAEPSTGDTPVAPTAREQTNPPASAETGRNAAVDKPASSHSPAKAAPLPKSAAIESAPSARPPPEESRHDGESSTAAKPQATEGEQGAAPARRPPQKARARAVRRQNAGGAGGGVGAAGGGGGSTVEFAPNPAPNQAARDFMSRPSSN